MPETSGWGKRRGSISPERRKVSSRARNGKRGLNGRPGIPAKQSPWRSAREALQVTPVQIAAVTALIAGRGTRIRPHFLLESEPATEPVAIPRPYFESVIEGMWRSTNSGGTSQAARIEGFDVCGKTGSTQHVGRETVERLGVQGKLVKTHSWFSGFAPRNEPRVVVTVLVEFGGMGGETAAPIAAQLFRTYKAKYYDR